MIASLRSIGLMAALAGVVLPIGSQSAPSASPLTRANVSVRARGMGGAGGAIPDPSVGTFNPGGLGVYALEGHASLYRTDQDLFPGIDTEHSATVVGAGMPIPGTGRGSIFPRVALALGYARIRGGVRNVEHSDGTVHNYIDRVDSRSLSLGMEWGIQFGAGLTWLDAHNSSLNTDADALDVGLFVRVPGLAALQKWGLTDERPRIGSFLPEIAVAASQMWAGKGEYEIGAEPLPRDNLFARSVEVYLERDDLTVMRVTLSRDDRTDRIRNRDSRYEGWEADFGGILQLRGGRFAPASSNQDNTTSGLSVHTRGVGRLLTVLLQDRSGSLWLRAARNVDVYYHRASFEVFREVSIEGFGVDVNVWGLMGR